MLSYLLSFFLFFHRTFFPLLSAQLISTESRGQTLSGRATTGINQRNRHTMARLWKDHRLHFRGCTFFLSFFLFAHFGFSSVGAANIRRITWANVKRAGDDGHQLKRNTRRRALEEQLSWGGGLRSKNTDQELGVGIDKTLGCNSLSLAHHSFLDSINVENNE